MMTAAMPVGASSAALSWEAIDWQTVTMQVRRLQLRIAKATREQRWGKVKALQWLLTHSWVHLNKRQNCFIGFFATP